uniref:Late embryogenesis abundant protein LEA-2 subgroup domain-containing protein n=1 Tax=Oryza punctata TaxID=4537 RepID=A0A0E0K063_ORYPU
MMFHMTFQDDERDLEAGQTPPPPPPLAADHETKLPKRKKRGCCCRLACAALVLVAVVAAAAGALYLALDPKLPRYTFEALTVQSFDMDYDHEYDDQLTARASFDAAVRFENPNRAIGISYEEGSSLAVFYGGHRLSEGALPAFYQGHGDAAVVHVAMSDAMLEGTGVVEAMTQVINDAGGELPLVFHGEVPVRVKVGPVTTGKLTPTIRCNLVLDRLSTEGEIRVKNMSCKIKLW